MPYPSPRNPQEDSKAHGESRYRERDRERDREIERVTRDFPSEFGNYPRRPDDSSRRADRERDARPQRPPLLRSLRGWSADPILDPTLAGSGVDSSSGVRAAHDRIGVERPASRRRDVDEGHVGDRDA